MKKLCIYLLIIGILLTGCVNSPFDSDIEIQRYEPDQNLVKDLHADFFYSYSNEELVIQADVIAKIKVEDIYHVKITSMDESIVNQKAMYGKFRVLELYYSKDRKVKKGSRLDINIFYDPAFANISAPGIEKDGEYIVFLEDIHEDSPDAWKSFDYVLISDFAKYKMDVTEENEEMIRILVNELK